MPKRVLIVDDEEWICSVLQDYLEESGYTVHTAASLSLARTEIGLPDLPDAVVVDMTLPDGSGLSLLNEMRGNTRTKEIPIILITAHTMQKVQENSSASMPNDCILKPFNLRDFKARLERQLH